jgi:hypothetical protein
MNMLMIASTGGLGNGRLTDLEAKGRPILKYRYISLILLSINIALSNGLNLTGAGASGKINNKSGWFPERQKSAGSAGGRHDKNQ